MYPILIAMPVWHFLQQRHLSIQQFSFFFLGFRENFSRWRRSQREDIYHYAHRILSILRLIQRQLAEIYKILGFLNVVIVRCLYLCNFKMQHILVIFVANSVSNADIQRSWDWFCCSPSIDWCSTINIRATVLIFACVVPLSSFAPWTLFRILHIFSQWWEQGLP